MILAGGLVLIDTPGLPGLPETGANAVGDLRALTMYARADLVLFACEATRDITDAELNVLTDLARLYPHVLVALTNGTGQKPRVRLTLKRGDKEVTEELLLQRHPVVGVEVRPVFERVLGDELAEVVPVDRLRGVHELVVDDAARQVLLAEPDHGLARRVPRPGQGPGRQRSLDPPQGDPQAFRRSLSRRSAPPSTRWYRG